MRRLAVLALVLVMPPRTAARPLGTTATSPVVENLRLELTVWDAAYGRGPIKARLTLTNRGKAHFAVRPSRELFSVDAHFPELNAHDGGTACVAATRAISFAARGAGNDQPLAPGGSTTTEVELPLVAGWYWLVARYELATTPGVWNGNLETPAIQFTVRGTPGPGMCRQNPGWDAFGPRAAPAAWNAADPAWKAGGTEAAASARFRVLWPALRSIAAHPDSLSAFDELVRGGHVSAKRVKAADAAAAIKDAVGKQTPWEVGAIGALADGDVWHVIVSRRFDELYAYIDADDGRLLLMWRPPEG